MNLIFQIILTALGAFLSVVLTRLLIQNGRSIRELGVSIRELGMSIRELGMRMEEGFRKMDERTEGIAKLIVTESEQTRELIKSLAK